MDPGTGGSLAGTPARRRCHQEDHAMHTAASRAFTAVGTRWVSVLTQSADVAPIQQIREERVNIRTLTQQPWRSQINNASDSVTGIMGSAPKLLALSDLHVAFPENRNVVENIRPDSDDDWLLV